MERAETTLAHKPEWLPEAFKKTDGAPDIEFKGYQYFMFPMDHEEFSDTGVIGNPSRATAEKGNKAFELYADHLVEALGHLLKVPLEVHDREFVSRV
jgi:creatinine amidohydrolase